MTHTLTPTADLATDIDDVARLLTPDGERIADPELERWVADIDAAALRGLYRDMVLLRRIDTEGVALHEHAQKADAYAKPTITARVPALFVEDFALGESSAIVEYIEDVYGRPTYAPVLPIDPKERARARQIMAWIRSDDTLPIREHRSTFTMFYEKAKDPLPDAARRLRSRACRISA